jgi:hypothetical protein
VYTQRPRFRCHPGVGLWDTTAGKYLVPGQNATATQPSGAGALPAPPLMHSLGANYNQYTGAATSRSSASAARAT